MCRGVCIYMYVCEQKHTHTHIYKQSHTLFFFTQTPESPLRTLEVENLSPVSATYQPFPLSTRADLGLAEGLALPHVSVGPEEPSLCPVWFRVNDALAGSRLRASRRLRLRSGYGDVRAGKLGKKPGKLFLFVKKSPAADNCDQGA